MSDKILIVTDPDDTLDQGIRISVIGLNPEQRLIVSKALLDLDSTACLITYIWDTNEGVNWIIDKIYKSDVIFFNAEIENQTLVGYLAAQSNAHYFGTLRTLKEVNTSVIYDVDRCLNILENSVKKHGKK
jgi:hypothetical protein